MTSPVLGSIRADFSHIGGPLRVTFHPSSWEISSALRGNRAAPAPRVTYYPDLRTLVTALRYVLSRASAPRSYGYRYEDTAPEVCDELGFVIPLHRLLAALATYVTAERSYVYGIDRGAEHRYDVGGDLYRNSPIRGTGRRRWHRHSHSPHTRQERFASAFINEGHDEDCNDYHIRVRGRRGFRTLTDDRDDYRGHGSRSANWKRHRLTQYQL